MVKKLRAYLSRNQKLSRPRQGSNNVTSLPRQLLSKLNPREEDDAYLKIMHWFFSYPVREIGLTELSRHLKIAKTTANRIVAKLAKEGFLKIEIIGNLWRISQDLSHEYNVVWKIPYNLHLVYQSGIINEIRKVFLNPRAIILFGSYRKGDDTEKSDIDIAVEVLEEKDLEIIHLGMIPQLGYRSNVPVNIHIFSRNKINLNLFANIANGIILEGFLEVRL
ncbi:nucleotidyltransferase domain-containing protein [Candidatus Woesearchaeota archaeon]|nr:nucleotidyltransferase domain-containing protein [Candidatus Woesearchaeota archaeon]